MTCNKQIMCNSYRNRATSSDISFKTWTCQLFISTIHGKYVINPMILFFLIGFSSQTPTIYISHASHMPTVRVHAASFMLDLNSFFLLQSNPIRWARSRFFVIVYKLHLFNAEIGYFTWIWPDAKCNMRNAISKREAVKWRFLNVYIYTYYTIIIIAAKNCNSEYMRIDSCMLYTYSWKCTTRGRRMGRWLALQHYNCYGVVYIRVV